MIDNEYEIICLAKNGDQSAIDMIVSDKNTLIEQIARRYYIQGGDMEDLVQEGRIGVCKAIDNYDRTKNDSFANFASKIIERTIIDAIRKENVGKNQMLDESVLVGEDDEELLRSDSTPEQDIIRNERLKELKEIISSKLSVLEKRVFDYYLQGYSYADIAKFLDENPKKIDNALTRIKLKLASMKEDL